MRLTSRRHASQLDMQMTSMIDVVFLLLIFFMVTSSFQKAERELDPAVKVERQSSSAPRDLAPTVIEVTAAGAGDGTFVYRVGGREIGSIDPAAQPGEKNRQLAAAAEELKQLLDQLENKKDGAFVRAADEAPFQMAAAAIQAAKDARFVSATYEVRGEN
jgi:biopolymer transport protein ExbD